MVELADGRYGGLGGAVRGFRRRAGLTQQEAAELAGLSVGALRDIEQGRVSRPRASTLRRLAGVLELSRAERDDLMREADDEPDHTNSGMRVEVLGPLRVLVDGAPVETGSETQQLLLGLLALSPNVPVTRDTLVELLWGGQPGDRSVESLQSRVSRLRRRLEPGQPDSAAFDVLVTVRDGYQLTVSESQHDLLVLRRLVARARRARDEGAVSEACRLYAEAVALWRGDPLAGLPALQSHPTVVALGRDYRVLVVEYAEAAGELGRHLEVLPLLQQLAEADPLHEAVHAALMIALAGSGQQAAALTVFDTLRRRLVAEMGADPGPELAAAYQRVLRQEVARPELAPVVAGRQLPPDIVDFSGRAAEVRQLWESVTAPTDLATPITVIEGMGGVGKTRLAVHIAHRLLAGGHYGDAQLYVDLRGHGDQPPADPATVLASFLRLLGVPAGRVPHRLDERVSLYRDRLHTRKALVLLDNAASEEQVLPLLPAGPANRVLVTSRRALALDGAHALPLDVMTWAESAALLSRVAGVARVTAEPEAVRRVVDLCGRLPLAVVLAARRLRSRSGWAVADLARRLENADDRLAELAAGGRTLRAVFDQSYRALPVAEQRLFRLLGLHPGEDISVDAVAALAMLPRQQASLLMDRLVDENLVMVRGHRYRLHDLLMEYARNLLQENESERERTEAHTRMLSYYQYVTAPREPALSA